MIIVDVIVTITIFSIQNSLNYTKFQNSVSHFLNTWVTSVASERQAV